MMPIFIGSRSQRRKNIRAKSYTRCTKQYENVRLFMWFFWSIIITIFFFFFLPINSTKIEQSYLAQYFFIDFFSFHSQTTFFYSAENRHRIKIIFLFSSNYFNKTFRFFLSPSYPYYYYYYFFVSESTVIGFTDALNCHMFMCNTSIYNKLIAFSRAKNIIFGSIFVLVCYNHSNYIGTTSIIV